MPLLKTKGAGSAQGFGLSLGGEEPVYVEDVFSTFLYTGNSSAQTITNGIDLAGKGGLVWGKSRTDAYGHWLMNSVSGTSKILQTNTTGAESTGYVNNVFNSNGFSVGGYGINNTSGQNYVGWTFRKQPKFFDVVTYTGDGAVQNIAHNLGSVPGCIIVKITSASGDWYVYHSTLGAGANGRLALKLNSSAAASDSGGFADVPTDTVFSVNYAANTNGETYVAYLWAHDAGGFGLSGTDNVVSCGSFTTDGSSNATINLGYEPQWVLIKSTDNSDSWFILDNMRGWVTGGNDARLLPNTSGAEAAGGNYGNITATGFQANGAYYANSNHIYIAIRRGPMEVPTSGTEVFSPVTRTGTGSTATITGLSFAPDLLLSKGKSAGYAGASHDRLRGVSPYLDTTATSAESSDTTGVLSYNMNGITVGVDNVSGSVNVNGISFAYWFFKRAPGFFDEVCYTGTGTSNRDISHNLGIAPEFVITKNRTTSGYDWYIYHAGTTAPVDRYLALNTTQAASTGAGFWRTMTSTTIGLGSSFNFYNRSGDNYVAYLFATVAGVSKVGSYTGTGTTQVIDCGFTAGARFILIKRTDSTGDWYVWDSARGIVAGNDPYLLLNSTAAEVTNTDFVDTASTGFEISSTAPAAINASGGSFIFLAIA